jgi:hypothetical protein
MSFPASRNFLKVEKKWKEEKINRAINAKERCGPY